MEQDYYIRIGGLRWQIYEIMRVSSPSAMELNRHWKVYNSGRGNQFFNQAAGPKKRYRLKAAFAFFQFFLSMGLL